MSTTYKILRSNVPSGGFGRALTSTEVTELRANGVVVSRGARVIQNRAPHLGIMYRPDNAGYAHTGVLLETR